MLAANFYITILLIVGAYYFIFTILNTIYIKVHTLKKPVTDEPFVSVLIPARNEEHNIRNCLNSFVNQTYKNYEIVVLDDNSTDLTHPIIREFITLYPEKVRMIEGKPLPEGWRGKCFAMKQLTQAARGEYFLFTDADTVHTENSISMMMSNMINHKADMVSGYLGQKLVTFGEKTIVPLMYLLTTICIPLWLNSKVKWPVFATAIGQFIGVKASSFKAIGGYDAIKGITTEDVYLARTMKKAGFKTQFLDFKDAATCRMYDSYKNAAKGISKNIFDFLGKHSILMLPIVLVIIPVLILPFPLFVMELLKVIYYGAPLNFWFWSLAANNILIWATWLIICFSRRIPLYISFLYPVMYVNLTNLVWMSWINSKTGKGYEWKGRIVH